jgi:hypothetical protein
MRGVGEKGFEDERESGEMSFGAGGKNGPHPFPTGSAFRMACSARLLVGSTKALERMFQCWLDGLFGYNIMIFWKMCVSEPACFAYPLLRCS